MNRLTLAVSVLLLASLVGCLPEEKVVWSPDGQRAAVIALDGLYLCDGEGRLSPRVAENVTAAAWLPDSKRLLVVRDTKSPAATWKDAAALIDEATTKAVMAGAAELRQEILSLAAPPDEFKPKLFEHEGMTQALLAAMYLRDNQSEGLAEKLGKHWEDVKKLELPVYAVEVGEVSADAVALKPVAKMLSAPGYLRLSPDGRYVAFVTTGLLAEGQYALMVMPVAGGRPLMVAEHVAPFTDWSGDGRYLVFARTTAPKVEGKADLRLGTISRTAVCDEKGGLLEKIPLAQDLAGLVFQDDLKVRGLRDGRILFAAAPIQLPCTTADMPIKSSLFAVDPERPATLVRMLPRSAEDEVPEAVNFFELSPDQHWVLIPGPKGVAIVELATGKVQKAMSEEQELVLQPVWRAPLDICFAVKKGSKLGSPNRSEVVLWSGSTGSQVLSKSWPDEMVEGMLRKPGEPAPKPIPSSAPTKPAKAKEKGKKAP